MPRGNFRKRETKKPKKKEVKIESLPAAVFTSSDVEVIKKKRKPREEEEP